MDEAPSGLRRPFGPAASAYARHRHRRGAPTLDRIRAFLAGRAETGEE